jgi:hypothetical protein
MPNPKPYEKKDDYISRCVGVLINEGKPTDQAVAICNSMWDEAKMSAYEKTIKKIKNNESNG